MAIRTNLKSLQPRRDVFKRSISLLSGGFSCRNAWPDGKITVYPWDTEIDAFLMKQTRQGGKNVLFDLLPLVCEMNGAPVGRFVLSELSAILLFSRALQHGGQVEYIAPCPRCHYQARETVTVPDDLEVVAQKDVTYTGSDTLILPDCQDTVRYRPLLIEDSQAIQARLETDNSIDERMLGILYPIVSVNDGKPDTVEELHEWYRAISPSDAVMLEKAQVDNSPHLNTSLKHVCDKCSHSYEHSISFDQEFFRPRIARVH